MDNGIPEHVVEEPLGYICIICYRARHLPEIGNCTTGRVAQEVLADPIQIKLVGVGADADHHGVFGAVIQIIDTFPDQVVLPVRIDIKESAVAGLVPGVVPVGAVTLGFDAVG